MPQNALPFPHQYTLKGRYKNLALTTYMYNKTHASTAPATKKNRHGPICRCEVLQIIIKFIDYLKVLTAGVET